jgi:hypothetical protein
MRFAPHSQCSVRPVFRLLAVVLALAFWYVFIVLAFHFDHRSAGLEQVWGIVACVFMAAFFSMAAAFGRVPRWMYRLIPYSWAWEKPDDKP